MSEFLHHLGADAATEADLEEHLATTVAPAAMGRVTRSERSGAEVTTEAGIVAATWDEPVCTGDWVVVSVPAPEDRRGHIAYCQPRRTAFVRRSADEDRPQVLAANLDEIWIVLPADQVLSPPRMERTLILAWESGAEPVVVLTKADMLPSPAQRATVVDEVGALGPLTAVVVVSSRTGEGIEDLAARVGPGRTAALLGASGAGKSSLVNALVGAEVVAVGAVREADGKGRHTTSWRELIILPRGGTLIDTPGLRGVGLWVDEGGLAATFRDITALVASCRFSDCAHDSEPGCAVKGAIDDGTLKRRRLDSYQKLQQEVVEAQRQRDARIADRERRESLRHRNQASRPRRR